jgi:hypothetical protein
MAEWFSHRHHTIHLSSFQETHNMLAKYLTVLGSLCALGLGGLHSTENRPGGRPAATSESTGTSIEAQGASIDVLWMAEFGTSYKPGACSLVVLDPRSDDAFPSAVLAELVEFDAGTGAVRWLGQGVFLPVERFAGEPFSESDTAYVAGLFSRPSGLDIPLVLHERFLGPEPSASSALVTTLPAILKVVEALPDLGLATQLATHYAGQDSQEISAGQGRFLGNMLFDKGGCIDECVTTFEEERDAANKQYATEIGLIRAQGIKDKAECDIFLPDPIANALCKLTVDAAVTLLENDAQEVRRAAIRAAVATRDGCLKACGK